MELATAKERAEQSLQHLAEHAASSRQAKMLQHEAERIEHKYGKKLERLARQLPVDTPLDRRRRHRARRHGVEVGVLVVALAGAAAVYFVMRSREADRAQWEADESESTFADSTSEATRNGTSNGSTANGSTASESKHAEAKMTAGSKTSATKSATTKP